MQKTISVEDCLTLADEEIGHLVAMAKIEKTEAVEKAIAEERKYYEPEIAKKTAIIESLQSDLSKIKKNPGELLIAGLISAVAGFIIGVLFV